MVKEKFRYLCPVAYKNMGYIKEKVKSKNTQILVGNCQKSNLKWLTKIPFSLFTEAQNLNFRKRELFTSEMDFI